MTEAHIPDDERLCKRDGCGKPAAEGWMLCEEHVEQRLASKSCRHGNFKVCIECLAESLREDAVPFLHNVPENELLAVTCRLDEHPEGWDWPCMCATCRSYAHD